MKAMFKWFGHFHSLGHPAFFNPDEPTADAQSPVPRVMTIAFVSCLSALVLVYWLARPVVARLGVWWAEVLVYAIIPVALTFAILHRSCWHQEMAGRARAGSLLLISCAIFGGALLAVGVLLSAAWFCSIAIRTGMGGR